MHFVVLSTSRGTTFQSIINSLADGSLSANCLGLVTDREDRECIQKAKSANLPYSLSGKMNKKIERKEYDKGVIAAVEELCEKSGVSSSDVVLAEMGWMWIHSPLFIQHFSGRIINVHPSLLPKYGGKGMYGHHVHDAVLKAGEHESGVSFHVMDTGVDTGPILLQKTCTVFPDDTADTLQSRVQELEKEWYPKLLEMIHTGQLSL